MRPTKSYLHAMIALLVRALSCLIEDQEGLLEWTLSIGQPCGLKHADGQSDGLKSNGLLLSQS